MDDDYLEALKDEIIDAKQQAVDENGKVLVWTGGSGTTPVPVAPSDLANHPPGSALLSTESLAPLQTDPVLQVVSPPGTPGTSEAERRQLTVMFCDLIDSTGLGALVICATSARKSGGNVKLVNLNKRNVELLVMTRLATAFEIFNDEQDAINSFYPDRKIKTFDILDFVQKMKQED